MDVWQVITVLRRRWYVALPIVLLAGLTAIVISGRVAVEYRSTASVVLVNPRTAPDEPPSTVEGDTEAFGDPSETPVPFPGATPSPAPFPTPAESTTTVTVSPGARNPWLSFSGSLSTVAQVLVLSASGQETGVRLAREGLSSEYVVTSAQRNPILQVEATASSPDVARRTTERLVELLRDDLAQRQAASGAPAETHILLDVLNAGDAPERLSGSRQRVLGVVLVLGISFAVACALAFDAVTRRTRVRARDRATSEAAGGSEGPKGSEGSVPDAPDGGAAEDSRPHAEREPDRKREPAQGPEPVGRRRSETGTPDPSSTSRWLVARATDACAHPPRGRTSLFARPVRGWANEHLDDGPRVRGW